MDTAAAATDYVDAEGDAHAELFHELATEEWLASRVLQQFTDVRAICNLALVNRNFYVASLSDEIWQKRLPPKPVLDAVGAPTLGKRELYIQLCKSIFYEEGRKKFWLHRSSGGECHMISARALTIIWGETTQYWTWNPRAGSMFSEVAELRSVCWFDISGTFRQCLSPGKYILSFRVQWGQFPRGWEDSPITLSVQSSTNAHPPSLSQVHFDEAAAFKKRCSPLPNAAPLAQASGDPIDETFEESGDPIDDTFEESDDPIDEPFEATWVECDAGEFLVEDGIEDRVAEVQFSMRETEVLWWKSGFVLDGVIIRPYDVARDSIIE